MVAQAQVIEKRHSKQCEICMLIDTDNKTMKWHLYKEGFMSTQEDDKHVCNDCIEGLAAIRKKCHAIHDNPKHDLFKDFVPWFYTQHPGMVDAYRANVTAK